MLDCPLAILQVSTADVGGGAEKVAWNLFQSYRSRGHASWLAVGRKLSGDSDVLKIPYRELHGSWSRSWIRISRYVESFDGRYRGAWRLSDIIRGVAEPRRWFDESRGIEDFHFPGSWRLLKLSPRLPQLVHLHNLHGSYFDLRLLPSLSQQVPVILTLHDAWLLTGHCAHSMNCERWKTGCGHCPDLTTYPAIRRDSTASNWRRKRNLYARSRLYVASPSRWLLQKVNESMLAPALAESRVIPNGIDLAVFRRRDKEWARAELDIPQSAKVIVFAATSIHHNVYKDFGTMRAALSLLGNSEAKSVIFLALGEDAPPERIGSIELRFVPYCSNAEITARYYQAADVYLHGARADTFPNSVIEALACGTPVVATAVGGIPEQVKGLKMPDSRWSDGSNSYTVQQASGLLVAPADAEGMAFCIAWLLKDRPLRYRLGANAARDARARFDLERQVDRYLDWYRELLSNPSEATVNDSDLRSKTRHA